MTNSVDNKEKDEYSVFLKHLQNEKEETSNFAKTLLVIVLILCGVMLGFLFCSNDEASIKKVFGENSKITVFLTKFSKSQENKARADFSLPFTTKRQNILLLGVDASSNPNEPWLGTRTDTIILLNIDPRTRSVNAISIPRDSKVYLSGDSGVHKINSAHAIGGIDMTKATIEQTLGIKIDRYVMVNDEAVKKVVDAIGGVPIYVEKNMMYNDYAGKLHINLTKGLNVLDGNSAVGYLRFRKDGLGDIGRTQRQQWFLRGLLEKLQQPNTIAKIPEILNVLTTYVKTDLSLYEISQLAAMTKSFDISKIEVATLPGAPNKSGYISYWILDPEKTQEVINRLVYRDRSLSDENTYKAGVIYTSKRKDDSIEVIEKLNGLGIEVNCNAKINMPHSQFLAQSQHVSNEFYHWLGKKIPQIQNTQFVYDPTKAYCVESDFTIILSDE